MIEWDKYKWESKEHPVNKIKDVLDFYEISWVDVMAEIKTKVNDWYREYENSDKIYKP